MMWIAVRRASVGETRPAARARRHAPRRWQAIFLAEAMALATSRRRSPGSRSGSGSGRCSRLVVPGLPVETPVRFVLAGLGDELSPPVSWPASRPPVAAALDPIEALRAE